MSRQKTIKDEFVDLDSDWKDGIVSMNKEEIDKQIAEIAKAEAANAQAKKDDQDLQEKKAACKVACEGYNEHTKMSKLRIKYCMQVLADRGKE